MELGEKDSSGRQRPVPIADSEFLVDVDLVILAIGQTPDLSFLGEEDGIAVTRSERINVSDTSYMTSRPGVFAVGDAVTRDKMAVIEAIGMGKESVTAMDAFIQGQQTNEVVVDAGQAPISLRQMTEDELVPKPPIPVPVIPMKQRLTSYTEVELGFSAEQAVAEANRCLVCGPCSECMACVQVCKTGAIVHDQDETFTELEIGAVIYADDPARFADLTMLKKKDVYCALPEDALQGYAAAASVMLDLFVERKLTQDRSDLSLMESPPRFGVFVCQCGGEISQVVDTQAVSDIAADWNDVIHTQVLPHACSPEAAQIIENAVQQYDLNKVVLAGCACCSIDQVCYSCTYQRIRVKDNLGVFASPQYLTEHLTKPDAINRKQALFEFVNIREQCAWAHPDDPQAATAKALSLIAAAVAGARKASAKPQVIPTLERSVLVLGSGAVALTFQETLKNQDIAVRHLESVPDHIQRTGGQYQAAHNGNVWRASVLALAPKNKKEGKQLLSSVGLDVNTSKTDPVWGGLDTLRPGVFYCDPGNKTKSTGAAAAARIAAWLGNKSNWAASTSAVVNPNRCRACGTCVEICEFCAIEITGDESQRSAWIDPIICTGCGVCAAHCPSGAITTRFSNDEQLTAMLNAALASGGGDNDAS